MLLPSRTGPRFPRVPQRAIQQAVSYYCFIQRPAPPAPSLRRPGAPAPLGPGSAPAAPAPHSPLGRLHPPRAVKCREVAISRSRVLLRWPPPGGLPQRPKVLSSGGSGVSEQAFRLRSFVRASPGTGLRAAAARFYVLLKRGGITLVHTSSTSAPELAAVLLQLLAACNGHCASWLLALAACVL